MKKRQSAATHILSQLSWEDTQHVMLEACERNMTFFMEYLRGQLRRNTKDPVVLEWIDKLEDMEIDSDKLTLYYDHGDSVCVQGIYRDSFVEESAVLFSPSKEVTAFLMDMFMQISRIYYLCTDRTALKDYWNTIQYDPITSRFFPPSVVIDDDSFSSPFLDGTFPNSPWKKNKGEQKL